MDYVFVNERPMSDEEGYYLNEAGERVLGGKNPQIATQSDPANSGFLRTLNGTASLIRGRALIHLQEIRICVSRLRTRLRMSAFSAAISKRSSSLQPEQKLKPQALLISETKLKTWQKNCLIRRGIKMTESESQQKKNMKIISATLRRRSTFRMAGAEEMARATPFQGRILCRLIRQKAETASISVIRIYVRK